MTKTIYLVSTLLILFCASLTAQVQGIDDTYYKVPDITLTDIDGNDHNLYEILDEGKFVLIDLYTTWCQPCRDNAPFVEEWYEEHGPNGDDTAIMWNVECDDNATDLQDVLDWIEEFSVTSVNFEENDYFWYLDEFPYNGYPTYFMICPDRYYGKVSGQGEELISAINNFTAACPALGTNDNDARLLVFEEDLNVQCDNPSPSIRIENRGLAALNSLLIETYVNGELDNAYNWAGSLQQYEEERIYLPQLTGTYSTEAQEISFKLNMPNGVEDQDLSDNNASGQFVLIDGAVPTIDAGFGYGAQSYTFQIINIDNEVVFEHTFDSNSSYGNESLDLCLSNNECYVFKMIDEVSGGGAGFIFSQEYLDLQFEGEQLLYIDETNYTQQIAEFTFCLGDPSVSVDDQDFDNQIKLYPNPSSGLVHVSVKDGLEINYEIWNIDGSYHNVGQLNGESIDFPESGFYIIKMSDKTGHVSYKKLTVMK